MILAADVLNNEGSLLLKAGTVLAVAHIQSIKGTTQAVFIKREGFDDALSKVIFRDEALFFSLIRRLEAIYCSLYSLFYGALNKFDKDKFAPPRQISNLEADYKDPIKIESILRNCVHDITDDIANTKYTLTSFDVCSPNHNGLYVFEHSVQTAVLAARMLEDSFREGVFRYTEDPALPQTLKTMPFDEKRYEDVIMAALLCEMGMLSIPVDILAKPAFDEDDKKRYLNQHPKISKEISRILPSISPVSAAIIGAHHERRDGNGYPKGAMDYHPLADVVSLAGVYDAMISSRPQRLSMGSAGDDKALTPAEALPKIKEMEENGLCDGGIFASLYARVVPYPFGTTLVLSNGDVGLVADCTAAENPARVHRPLVRCSQNIQTGKRGVWEVDLAACELDIKSAIYA